LTYVALKVALADFTNSKIYLVSMCLNKFHWMNFEMLFYVV